MNNKKSFALLSLSVVLASQLMSTQAFAQSSDKNSLMAEKVAAGATAVVGGAATGLAHQMLHDSSDEKVSASKEARWKVINTRDSMRYQAATGDGPFGPLEAENYIDDDRQLSVLLNTRAAGDWKNADDPKDALQRLNRRIDVYEAKKAGDYKDLVARYGKQKADQYLKEDLELRAADAANSIALEKEAAAIVPPRVISYDEAMAKSVAENPFLKNTRRVGASLMLLGILDSVRVHLPKFYNGKMGQKALNEGSPSNHQDRKPAVVGSADGTLAPTQ